MLLIESVEEYVRLWESKDDAAWQRLKHDDAPLGVWLGVIRDHPDMRYWVAFNRTVPPQVLRVLVCDSDRRVRRNIAVNRDIPADIIELVSYDDDAGVAAAVAGNPLCSTPALERLRNYPWDKVRERAEKQLAERRAKQSGDGPH